MRLSIWGTVLWVWAAVAVWGGLPSLVATAQVAAEEDAPEEDAPEEDAPEEDAPEEDAPEDDAPEEELPVVEDADDAPAEVVPGLESVKQKASYAIGMNMGANLRQQVESDDIDVETLIRGLSDALAENDPALSEDELAAAMQSFIGDMRERQQTRDEERREANKEVVAKNKEDGEAYLAANKKKKGVKTTKSGLQYKVLREGKGDSPTESDTVTTHYRGALLDGTEFDSSYERGEPATFAVGGVIAGWTEVLQLMKPGAKYEVYIPSDLAYGDDGAGDDIPPGATLVFEIELITVDEASLEEEE